jgi:lauroyl/myristoyl acyltransferase
MVERLRRALLDAVAWVLARVPLRLASGVAWGVAWLWWWVIPIRKQEAVDAFKGVFPELESKSPLMYSMWNLIFLYIEYLQYDSLTVTVTGAEELKREPGLILGGHSGAFEVGLLGVSATIPTAIFVKTQSDPWAQEKMHQLRARKGMVSLYTGAGLEEGYKQIEAGRSIIFVQDQRYNKGILSPFCGIPALTSPGFAVAYLKTRKPVWGAWIWREGREHRVHFEKVELPELSGNFKQDVQLLTDAGNRWYEQKIRERPESWFWLHRRWKK